MLLRIHLSTCTIFEIIGTESTTRFRDIHEIPGVTRFSSGWARSGGGRSVRAQMERRTPRFPCSASAELTWDHSVELTRVTELSRYGCYLETSKSLPTGTRVTLKVMDKGKLFEATATVLYSRPTLGMGVAFREVKSTFQIILEDWLRESLDRQRKRPSIDDFEAQ